MRLLALLFSLASLTSFGQDYVVTVKGDSLGGSIKILSYDLLDRVQLFSADKKTIYTAMQVRSFVMQGEAYKPGRSGNAVRFMKVLKSGYLSLYAFKPENQNQYDGRMLVKLDGKAIEVPNLGFKKMMMEFLEDCESVTSKIKSGELSRKNLDEIIGAYNACMSEKTKALAKETSIVENSKDKLTAIAALRIKIEKANDPKTKDALDLLTDVEAKVKKGETIANYQKDALKGMLANVPDVSKELVEMLSLLK